MAEIDGIRFAPTELSLLQEEVNRLTQLDHYRKISLDNHRDSVRSHPTLPQIKTKKADQTVNNSTTLVDDDTIKQTIQGKETWKFHLMLFVDSGATPDWKIGITAPSGATGYWEVMGSLADAITDVSTPGTTNLAMTGNPIKVEISGVIINGVNRGDIQLQWAQNTADLSNTDVLAGSHGEFIKIG